MRRQSCEETVLDISKRIDLTQYAQHRVPAHFWILPRARPVEPY
jgi:hypothetical protein